VTYCQPAAVGCNRPVDVSRALITAMLVSLPTGLAGDRQRLICGERGGPCAARERTRATSQSRPASGSVSETPLAKGCQSCQSTWLAVDRRSSLLLVGSLLLLAFRLLYVGMHICELRTKEQPVMHHALCPRKSRGDGTSLGSTIDSRSKVGKKSRSRRWI
jgi:hypothetical protein